MNLNKKVRNYYNLTTVLCNLNSLYFYNYTLFSSLRFVSFIIFSLSLSLNQNEFMYYCYNKSCTFVEEWHGKPDDLLL